MLHTFGSSTATPPSDEVQKASAVGVTLCVTGGGGGNVKRFTIETRECPRNKAINVK